MKKDKKMEKDKKINKNNLKTDHKYVFIEHNWEKWDYFLVSYELYF